MSRIIIIIGIGAGVVFVVLSLLDLWWPLLRWIERLLTAWLLAA